MNYRILLIFPLLMMTLPMIVLSLKLFFREIPLIMIGFLSNRGKYSKQNMHVLEKYLRVISGVMMSIWYLLIIIGSTILIIQYISNNIDKYDVFWSNHIGKGE